MISTMYLFNIFFHIIIFYQKFVKGQSGTPFVPVAAPTNFQEPNPPPADQNESWLKKDNRFVFVIVLGLLVVILLLWYIVKSIKGMRKRLKRENEAQMNIIQQVAAHSTLPISTTTEVNHHSQNNIAYPDKAKQ
ncbi:hypothetical protein BJ944DRAFT_266932 [Cunninghamella echinulata]|nr:hypothetical protein BJ944DRAFT_266932 [Cunninghamella echinulata]